MRSLHELEVGARVDANPDHIVILARRGDQAGTSFKIATHSADVLTSLSDGRTLVTPIGQYLPPLGGLR